MIPSDAIASARFAYRQGGLSRLGTELLSFGRRTIDVTLRGRPGYYAFQYALLRRRYDDTSVLQPITVSPDSIEYLAGSYERRRAGHLDYQPHFKPREATWNTNSYEEEVPFGAVRGGDWDRSRHKVSKLLLHRGIEQRFEEGHPWEETVFSEELRARLESSGWPPPTAKERVNSRCQSIEQLYRSLESNGYESQQRLRGHPLHEVTVVVGRDGELLYNCEGRHRLAIASILDIDALPALVLVTHEAFEGDLTDVGL